MQHEDGYILLAAEIIKQSLIDFRTNYQKDLDEYDAAEFLSEMGLSPETIEAWAAQIQSTQTGHNRNTNRSQKRRKKAA